MSSRLTLIHPNGDKTKCKVVLSTKAERRTLDLVTKQTFKNDSCNLESAYHSFNAHSVCWDLDFDCSLIQNHPLRTFLI
jgi:hypothetical protein